MRCSFGMTGEFGLCDGFSWPTLRGSSNEEQEVERAGRALGQSTETVRPSAGRGWTREHRTAATG